MGVACQLDILGHYYEIGKIVHSDTIIFKMSNLNQKSSHKLDAKGKNFKTFYFTLVAVERKKIPKCERVRFFEGFILFFLVILFDNQNVALISTPYI